MALNGVSGSCDGVAPVAILKFSSRLLWAGECVVAGGGGGGGDDGGACCFDTCTTDIGGLLILLSAFTLSGVGDDDVTALYCGDGMEVVEIGCWWCSMSPEGEVVAEELVAW